MWPLHLHGLWIGILLVVLVLVSVLVAATILVWLLRWDLTRLDSLGRHKLLVAAVVGIVLSVAYWGFVLVGTVELRAGEPVHLVLSAAASSSGLAGLAALWLLHLHGE